MDARRTTRDADLLALATDRDIRNVVAIVTEIAAVEVDDGVRFVVDAVRPASIRQDDLYAGVRVVVPALIGRAQAKLALDVNFGDPVTPGAVRTSFPELLSDNGFPLLCYPIETVLAEKITTMLALGDLSTRDRDWADVWRLTGRHELDGDRVQAALRTTGAHRRVNLGRLSEVVVRLPTLRQSAYAAWRRRQSVEAVRYPERFEEVVRGVIEFADLPLLGAATARVWIPFERRWSSEPAVAPL
jgi:hypothetical protein